MSEAGMRHISVRVSEEMFDWVSKRGGRTFVRSLILAMYTKRVAHEEVDLPNFPIGTFGRDSKRLNVRLHPQLRAFVDEQGGAPYVRFLIHDYMLFKAAQEKMIPKAPSSVLSQH